MIVRVVLGVSMFAHGAQNVLGWFGGPGLRNSLRSFREQLHIPAAPALLALAAEFLGGLGLIVGLFSRVAALGIAVTMLVAAMVHFSNGFFLNWYGTKKGHGFEYHILVIALALVVIAKGAGGFSADRLLYQHFLTPADTGTSQMTTGR
jgi:putative oxidoreductase